MIKILCPTDFSDHAEKALEYAVYMSNLLNAELHVITAYKVPTTASSMIALRETIHHNRMLDIEKLVSKWSASITSEHPPVLVAHKGMPPAVISNYAEHNDIAMVIMGTQGNSSVKNILFGSVTRKVANKINVPLLAVPMQASYADLKGKPLLLALDSKQVGNEKILDMPV